MDAIKNQIMKNILFANCLLLITSLHACSQNATTNIYLGKNVPDYPKS